jgi:hypothetical protein
MTRCADDARCATTTEEQLMPAKTDVTVKWLLALRHVIVLVFLWTAFAVLSVVALLAIGVTGRYAPDAISPKPAAGLS